MTAGPFRQQHRSAALAGAALLLFGCARPQKPALPTVSLQGLPAAVSAAIDRAAREAASRPDDAATLAEYAYTLQAHGQYAAASAVWKRALAIRKDYQWQHALALAYESQAMPAEAASAFGAVLELKPDFLPARLLLAERLLESGDPVRAVKDFQAVLQQHPDDARARYGLGRCLSASGDVTGAMAEWRKALELVPAYGAAHYALALALQKGGDAAAAQTHFAQHKLHALVVPPLGDPVQQEIEKRNAGALALIREAARAAGSGSAQQAIDLLQQALRLEPSQVQAHINLQILYARTDRPEEAERHFREAIRLAPNRADAYYNDGVMQFSRRRLAQARADFEQAIAINPLYGEAHTNLGFCLEQEGKMGEAERHYAKAVEVTPSYRLARLHLARLLTARGLARDAVAVLEPALQPEDADTPGYAIAMGTVYAAAGRPGEAKAAWQNAMTLARQFNQPQVAGEAARLLSQTR